MSWGPLTVEQTSFTHSHLAGNLFTARPSTLSSDEPIAAAMPSAMARTVQQTSRPRARILQCIQHLCEPCYTMHSPAPKQEESGDEEKTPGAVLRCLTEAIGETHVACAEETVRAVHSALQFYQPVRDHPQNPGSQTSSMLLCHA